MIGSDRFDQDWQSLGAEWRAQSASQVDVVALRAEVRRRSRRLWGALALEVAMYGLALAIGVWVLLLPDTSANERGVISGALLMLTGFEAWVLWSRRGQVRDNGLGTTALVTLEVDRARTSLRYWRVSMWLSVLLWCGALCWAVLTIDAATADRVPALWAGALLGSGVTLIGFGVFAWWLSRRNKARLVRLLALHRELTGE